MKLGSMSVLSRPWPGIAKEFLRRLLRRSGLARVCGASELGLRLRVLASRSKQGRPQPPGSRFSVHPPSRGPRATTC